MSAFHSPLTSRSTVRPGHSTIERTFSTGQNVCAGQRVEWGERKQPRRCYQHRDPGPNHYQGVAVMSIANHDPVRPSHTPTSAEERTMLATDSELSQLMQESFDNKDFDTLAYAIAEKRSIERALGESRWETFNHRMDREFFGGDS